MKLIKIKFAFVLKSAGTSTIVKKKIDIKSILSVKGIMNSIFEKHHAQLF